MYFFPAPKSQAMTGADIAFTEDIFAKIAAEYNRPGEWHHRMLIAYLLVLLTYLSRLYSEQHKATEISPERTLLKNFQAKVNESLKLHSPSVFPIRRISIAFSNAKPAIRRRTTAPPPVKCTSNTAGCVLSVQAASGNFVLFKNQQYENSTDHRSQQKHRV
jgi:hypothetical protein